MSEESRKDEEENEENKCEFSTRRPKRVNADTVSYFRQISAAFENGEEDEDGMELLVENAIEEMSGNEASMASHKMCSYVVEMLLRAASDDQLLRIADSFTGFYLHLFTNRYASHVIESLFARFADILSGKSHQIKEKVSDVHVRQICEEVQSSWIPILSDPCGCHCLRALVNLLSGRAMQKKQSASKRKKKRKKNKNKETTTSEVDSALSEPIFTPPEPFAYVLEEILEGLHRCIESSDKITIETMCFSGSSSGTLQHVLMICDDSQKRKKMKRRNMISEIIELVLHMNDAEMMKTMTLRMACHPAASPLLETFLMVSPNHLSKLFNVVFLPSIEDLAMDGYGNFALQRMLSLLCDSKAVSDSRQALESNLSKLLQSARGGVVWRLVEACGRVNVYEGLVKCLQDALGGGTDWLSKLLFRGSGGENPFPMECCIVSALLDLPLSESRCVLESILELDVKTIQNLACHPWGSRNVIEPILDGPHEFAQQKLVKRFLKIKSGEEKSYDDDADARRKVGTVFANLSSNRFGAYFVQKCFNVSQPKDRKRIVKQLVAIERKLSGDRVGQKVLEHCRAQQFIDAPKEWMDVQTKQWERRSHSIKKQKKLKKSKAVKSSNSTTTTTTTTNTSTTETSVIDNIFSAAVGDDEKKKKRKRSKDKKKKKKKKKKRKVESNDQ
eukprot:g128.t1